MEQLREAVAGPHGMATIITWVVAGLALALAGLQAVRPRPRTRRWSRAVAVAFPAAIAGTLLIGSVAPAMHGTAFDVVMFLRMTGFWATVALAPLAVGQVFGLRPPPWLTRTHLLLGAAFLLLLVTTDLAFARTDAFDPQAQFGPLAVVLLLPVAAVTCWWLLACLGEARTWWTTALFGLGAGITAAALVAAALVVEPAVADHLLVVGFLPVLAATQLVEVAQAQFRRHHRRQLPAGHPQ